MSTHRFAARSLAAALCATPWTYRAVTAQVLAFCGPQAFAAQADLVAGLLELRDGSVIRDVDTLAAWLDGHRAFRRASVYIRDHPEGVAVPLATPLFRPVPALAACDLPAFATTAELAAWLGLSLAELDWFADARRQHGRTLIPDLQHYRYHLVRKRNGASRLIEAPKARMKTLQRRILHGILDRVPTHPCAHGFVAGRSCLTAAAIHVGEAIVVTADLTEFFPATRISRAHATFCRLGYPAAVARALTGLCSTSTPRAIFERLPAGEQVDWCTRGIYGSPHLPQGAPTSPALANLAAYGLDVRLTGLARSFSARYTRYADDLAFSGDAEFAARHRSFRLALAEIVRDAGYRLHPDKSRTMPRHAAQRITGLVVNAHLNVSRADYDRLKAILHNCCVHGPTSQNRDGHVNFRAHLDGRVQWVEQVNPQRGVKLRKMFRRIAW